MKYLIQLSDAEQELLLLALGEYANSMLSVGGQLLPADLKKEYAAHRRNAMRLMGKIQYTTPIPDCAEYKITVREPKKGR